MSNNNQYLKLWVSVIVQAINDYQKGSLAEKRDAVRFFNDEYFEMVCEILDINSKIFRKKILRRKIDHKTLFLNRPRISLCFECGQRFEIAKMKKLDYNTYVCKNCKKHIL